jgi:16S rRNA (cytidine1402-2'-O)-methyltransferase
LALHEHNEAQQSLGILARLQGRQSVALISDAGTPLISDPGYVLVRQAREIGLPVVPIPGPCALVAALSVSGLPTDRFAFEGFLPARRGARRRHLSSLQREPRTLIFYEVPHRIVASLEDMEAAFGARRPAALARELTKLFEEIRDGNLGELRQWMATDPERRRGEFVVMVGGAGPETPQEDLSNAKEILTLLLEELPLKRAVSLTARLTGQAKNMLYEIALGLQRIGP